ncbi:hypothetical protein [uncultured Photobacterium sp.]|uniref:hypothetical protein n=1 Tax=uncultured Photobacterium sp. TaxID=173973 RepID=UPI002636DB96|nr:hypothetical protein [uncultured Photobacterium sp.]
MAIDKEQKCMQLCVQAKIESAKSLLDELHADGVPFDYPSLGDLFRKDSVEWNDKLGERTVQIFIFCLIFTVLVFCSPFALLLYTYKWINTYCRLKLEILSLRKEDHIIYSPEVKTIENLWRCNGLLESKYSNDEKLSLLNEWIKVLYGYEVANQIDIEGRYNKIISSHVKLNTPYYQGVKGAPHFYFGSPFDSLISSLSKELSSYE